MRWRTLLVTVALAFAIAACGGAEASPPSQGKRLFSEDCAVCHTLTGVNSPSHQGGDLLRAQMSRSDLLQFTREMPVRHALSQAQLATVADYVLAVQRRGR
jgi:mono/diheme cytochrome c family protein